MSKALPTIHTAPEELRDWLEKLVKELQFARLISAVVALVTRLRDMNTVLTKQLANLRRARPRSERMRAELSAQGSQGAQQVPRRSPQDQAILTRGFHRSRLCAFYRSRTADFTE